MTAEQLRNSILQEAISGRLVPQDPNDEPASVLLQRIREEKAKLVKAKQISKRDFEVLPITEDDVDFDIPVTWEWVRLGDIFKHSTGKALNEANKKGCLHDYITTSNVYWGYFKLDKLRQMYYTEDEKEKCMATKGDLLVLEGGDVGRAAIWDKDYDIFLQNHIHKLRAYIPVCTKFYYYCLYLFHDMGLVGGKGIGIQGLSSGALHQIILPLPPLAEQKRIVAKLEELLPIVEQYGKAQKELDELNAALPVRLRTSILQEAMQGKLVPNDESEMPFTIFNSQIEARKQGEIKAKRLKKSDAVVKPITEDEIPFEIPSNWTWYRLSDLANMYTGDSINAEQKLKYYTNVKGMEYIATKDVKFDHKVDYANGVAIPDERRDKFRIAPAGSILLCVEGGSAGRKIATIERDVCFGNKLCCFATYIDINPFLYYYLQSPMFKDVFRNSITGIIGGVAIKTLRDLLVPLPPLAEQERIVAKIEELFAEIDKITK